MRAAVEAGLAALSQAFRAQDVEAALRCFVDDDSIVYAGSEAGEVAQGRQALRALLIDLFSRDEAYSWTIDRLWVSEVGEMCAMVADLTASASGADVTEHFAYRISGVGRPVHRGLRWVVLHGAEPQT